MGHHGWLMSQLLYCWEYIFFVFMHSAVPPALPAFTRTRASKDTAAWSTSLLEITTDCRGVHNNDEVTLESAPPLLPNENKVPVWKLAERQRPGQVRPYRQRCG